MSLPYDMDDDKITVNPTIGSVKAILGDELYIKLSEELGGVRLYIATTPTPNSPLVACIGMKAAIALGRVYGGESFTVSLEAGRNAKILKLYKEGVPVVRIPYIVKCSYSAVQKLLQKVRRDTSQLNLFDK